MKRVSMKRGGFEFGDGKTKGCPWPTRGSCRLQISTQTQRVSTPHGDVNPFIMSGSDGMDLQGHS